MDLEMFPTEEELDDDLTNQYEAELEYLQELEETQTKGRKVKKALDFENSDILFLNDLELSSTTTTENNCLPKIDADKKRKIDNVDEIENNISKKSKADPEIDKDMEMIEHILYLRKIHSEKKFASSYGDFYQPKKSFKLILSRPNYPHIEIPLKTNISHYARLLPLNVFTEEIERISKKLKFNNSNQRLMQDFDTVYKNAEEILLKKQSSSKPINENGFEKANDENNYSHEKMWVEKYKPRRYMELLSDETTNRTLLSWIKQWDKCVFNRDVSIKEKDMTLEVDPLDENGVPRTKVVLLCGPPGLGKTTLAHLVAKHAGYRPVEVNASDDRSPEFFIQALEAATQMQAVIGEENPRPNCLILDEIDGAPAISIDILIKYITGKRARKTKRKKQNQVVVKRPIICICNEAYGPALRSLRQMALIINVPSTPAYVLKSRLQQIAHREGLQADLASLDILVSRANTDIRSCLTAMQWCRARGQHLAISDALLAAVGNSGSNKGLFAVWQQIFHKKRQKFSSCIRDSSFQDPVDGECLAKTLKNSPSQTNQGHMDVLRCVQTFGDYERIALGVFENFLWLNRRQTDFHSITNGLDWFTWFDHLQTHLNVFRNYVIFPYQSYCFLQWHLIFGDIHWPKISYPRNIYDVKVKESRNRQLVKELQKHLEPHLQITTNFNSFLLEILPYITYIISPPLRSLNPQLYNHTEKNILTNLIKMMMKYQLTYIYQQNEDGSQQYLLEPNISQLVFMKGNQSPLEEYSQHLRQIIAHEISTQNILKHSHLTKLSEQIKPQEIQKEKETTTTPNFKPRRLQPNKQYFIRQNPKKNDKTNLSSESKVIFKSGVIFKFREEQLSGLRKPVRICDL